MIKYAKNINVNDTIEIIFLIFSKFELASIEFKGSDFME